MSVVLEIGERVYTSEDLVPLLSEYQILPKLAQEIIIDETLGKVECSTEEKTSVYNRFCQQNQLITEEQVQNWLKQQNMTPQQLEKSLLKKLKLDKFKENTWGDQVEAYFTQRKTQLDRVVYSLIRTDKPEVAQELYFRIQEKESSFRELAMEYSLGSEAQTGGLIGPVEINAPHPKIAQLLSTMKPGQIVPPTRVGEWIVVIRLENYLSAELDAAMRQRMLDSMFREWLTEEINQKVSFLPNTVTS